jgi:MFS family permease
MTSKAVDNLSPEAEAPSLWRHSDFNKLWLGQSVSVLGSRLTVLALPLTAILTLKASAEQIGFLNGAGSIASLVVTLFAGVLVDRVRRRPVMIAADLGRTAFIGLIPLLAWTHHLTIAILYVVAVAVGSLEVLFDLAQYAYMPILLSGDQLVSGNSRTQATQSMGTILGSSVGGFLITIFRPAFVMLGDSLSFLVSVLTLAWIRTPEPAPKRVPLAQGKRTGQVARDIAEGAKVTYANKFTRPLSLNSAGANFGAMVILTLFILYANKQLHISPTWIGIIYACGGAGGVAGAVSTGWATRRFGFGRAVLGAMLVYRALIFTPLVTGPRQVEVVLFCIIWFLTVFGVVMSNIGQGSLQQRVIPSELRGRVAAAATTLGQGVLPFAAVIAGILGTRIGLRGAIAVGAIVMPLPLLWVIFSPVPRLAKLTDAPSGDELSLADQAGGGDAAL